MNRRDFVKNAGLLSTVSCINVNAMDIITPTRKSIRVIRTGSNFEREKLLRPFGFKGGYLTELWQTVAGLTSESGNSQFGLATQSVLYGDAELFSSCSEAAGNAMMYTLTEKALQLIKETSFKDPVELLDRILPAVLEAGKKITGKQNLNLNFVYNALVSVDNAAWLLYAKENKLSSMDEIIPSQYKKALSYRNDKIAVMYQVPYKMPMSELVKAVQQGYFIIKIKAGYPGTQEEMLKGDMERLSAIHGALKEFRTNHTKDGKLVYTIDANGRYETKATLMRYLDHAKKTGAFEQIHLFEEPFVETNDEDVTDTGIRIGADESVHTEKDALKRISQGYSALVLKGIAKTLSESIKIAKLATEKSIPCICADLTVNPILIDWHKNLACRLAPFPGINMAMMETNGDMNYSNWKQMQDYHPLAGASWMKVTNGVFELNEDFYKRSGGIMELSKHYQGLLAAPAG